MAFRKSGALMKTTVPVNFNGRIHRITGFGRLLNQEDIDTLAKYGIDVSLEDYLVEYEHDGVKYRGVFPKTSCVEGGE